MSKRLFWLMAIAVILSASVAVLSQSTSYETALGRATFASPRSGSMNQLRGGYWSYAKLTISNGNYALLTADERFNATDAFSLYRKLGGTETRKLFVGNARDDVRLFNYLGGLQWQMCGGSVPSGELWFRRQESRSAQD